MAGTRQGELSLRETIKELYELVGRLENAYPGRHFTPDGHLVGSLGEVYAAERYGLKLFEASYPVHDAETKDGKLVQIKATQGNRIALNDCPDHLIVLRITKAGEFEEIYNGPGKPIWEMKGKPQKTSQYQISLNKLAKAAKDVPAGLRIHAVS